MPDRTATPWNQFRLAGLSPDDWISKNFTAAELTKSELATRHGINNGFTDDAHLQCAVHLCREVLQPVREKFGRYTPNSVYRSQALERKLKEKPPTWVSSSQHTLGQACDIEVLGASNRKLAEWVRANLTFDQLILECYSAAEGANSGWVHVSLLPPGRTNRGEVLSYVKDRNGQFVFVKGLLETPP